MNIKVGTIEEIDEKVKKEILKPVIYRKETLERGLAVLYWQGENDLKMREFIIFLSESYFPAETTIEDVEILFIGQPQRLRRNLKSIATTQKKCFVLFAEIPYSIYADQVDGNKKLSSVKFTSEIMPVIDNYRSIYPKKYNK